MSLRARDGQAIDFTRLGQRTTLSQTVKHHVDSARAQILYCFSRAFVGYVNDINTRERFKKFAG